MKNDERDILPIKLRILINGIRSLVLFFNFELETAIEKEYREKPETKKLQLMLEKSWKLIQNQRMKDLSKKKLEEELLQAMQQKDFNFYGYLSKYF